MGTAVQSAAHTLSTLSTRSGPRPSTHTPSLNLVCTDSDQTPAQNTLTDGTLISLLKRSLSPTPLRKLLRTSLNLLRTVNSRSLTQRKTKTEIYIHISTV